MDRIFARCLLNQPVQSMSPDDAGGESFDIYYKELVFWNKKINLVSTDTHRIYHQTFYRFADPRTVHPCPGGRLLDIVRVADSRASL